jgi:hypothetical protein
MKIKNSKEKKFDFPLAGPYPCSFYHLPPSCSAAAIDRAAVHRGG